MTAAPAILQTVGGSEGRLLTALQAIHGPWLQEARKLLDSARRPEAGIHCRWRAVPEQARPQFALLGAKEVHHDV